MCGRFNFTAEESAEIRDIIREVQRRQDAQEMKTGEIFPTNCVPVLVREKEPVLLSWGFPGFKGKGVIINARAETAAEKPMFRGSLAERRCVIPTTGFYEWGPDKQKYLFRLPDTATLYMAGLYNEFGGERRFVILTTEANASIADIHNRMPVILSQEGLNDWLSDEAAATKIMTTRPPILQRQAV